MKALKKILEFVHQNPLDQTTQTLSALVLALETEAAFDLSSLYRLPFVEFELAMELMADWRLDRYYSSKLHLLELPVRAVDLATAEA